MSLHIGPDMEDPGPKWRDLWYCQTCAIWTDNPQIFHARLGHFLLEPYSKTGHTEPPVHLGAVMAESTLSQDPAYNDLEDDLVTKRRRLHATEYELAAQISIRKAMNNGLYNGDPYWRAIEHENYLILRCLELKRIVIQAQEALSKYDTDHLPNWTLNPDNYPQVEA